jgi:hypothetical protein
MMPATDAYTTETAVCLAHHHFSLHCIGTLSAYSLMSLEKYARDTSSLNILTLLLGISVHYCIVILPKVLWNAWIGKQGVEKIVQIEANEA